MAKTSAAKTIIVQRLIEVAMKKETTYYEELATLAGLPNVGNQMASVIGSLLGEVFTFCHKNNWPPLTSLVVRKSGTEAGIPGSGFWTLFEQVKAPEAGVYTQGPLALAPKKVKLAITNYLHIRCYGYFHDLVTSESDKPKDPTVRTIGDLAHMLPRPVDLSTATYALQGLRGWKELGFDERVYVTRYFDNQDLSEAYKFAASLSEPCGLWSSVDRIRQQFGELMPNVREYAEESFDKINGYEKLTPREQYWMRNRFACLYTTDVQAYVAQITNDREKYAETGNMTKVIRHHNEQLGYYPGPFAR